MLLGRGAVSNYRVRQVLAIKPKLLDSRTRLMIAIATWMTDDSTTAEISFEVVMDQAQLARNTARDARAALMADGYLTWTSPHGRGRLTVWTFHRLPELKGVSDPDLFTAANGKGVSDVDPLPAAEKGSATVQKRGQPQHADLRKHSDKLNRLAKNTHDASRRTPRRRASRVCEYNRPIADDGTCCPQHAEQARQARSA
jgi:hypothetical protein